MKILFYLCLCICLPLLGQVGTDQGSTTAHLNSVWDLSLAKIKPGATVFASLPSAATNTNVAYLVTDCSSAACTAGGGTVRAWKVSDGATWVTISGSAGGGGSVFTGSTAVTSAFSATPTFSLADVSVKSPTRFEPGAMTANVTAVTFTNKTAGAKFSIAWLQNGAGGWTVAYGASATGACQVSPTASVVTTQFFEVAADATTVIGTGCSTTDTGLISAGPEGTVISTTAAGDHAFVADSASHTGIYYANNSSNRHAIPRVASGDQLADADLSTSDVTTNNVSITKHGFAPKAPNDATKYLDGTGNYTIPAGSGGGGGIRSIQLLTGGGNTGGNGMEYGNWYTTGTGVSAATVASIRYAVNLTNSGTPTITAGIRLPYDMDTAQPLQIRLNLNDGGGAGGSVQFQYGLRCWITATAASATMTNSVSSGSQAFTGFSNMLVTGLTTIPVVGCAKGDFALVQIQRDNTVGSNMAAAVSFIGAELRYTSTY